MVYEQNIVEPNTILPYDEVGYNYKIEFRLDGEVEKFGTELFRSENSVFYLSDPIQGMMGFARDGYLNVFPYRVKKEMVKIRLEGDSISTRLFIDDKLVEDMQIERKYFNAGKDSMNYVRTLVFPLHKSGNFNSKVKNLKIYQYKR